MLFMGSLYQMDRWDKSKGFQKRSVWRARLEALGGSNRRDSGKYTQDTSNKQKKGGKDALSAFNLTSI